MPLCHFHSFFGVLAFCSGNLWNLPSDFVSFWAVVEPVFCCALALFPAMLLLSTLHTRVAATSSSTLIEPSVPVHLRPRRFRTPPKFHEKTPRETQKERNGGGKKKKAQNFGPPHPSRPPPFRDPTLRGPVWASHPSVPHPRGSGVGQSRPN